MTPTIARRQVLQSSAAAGLIAMLSEEPAPAQTTRETLVVGLVGCGGRGNTVAGLFQKTPGIEIAYVCDVDEQRRLETAKKLKVASSRTVSDMRRVLDDKSVDAVIVATPDHWHAPAAILACDAGKHVYVEKPIAHNIREGRLLVQAAERNKRLVQHGTQNRSTTMMTQAVKALHDGLIGTVLVAKCWNVQKRRTIGRDRPTSPPPGFDHDLWCGPAPLLPFQQNRSHGGWHWWYAFGTGDMGNDGVHDIDYTRWGLGVTTHPTRISAIGGKYFFDDDQQFPDTQQVAFEYAGDGQPGSKRMLIYEMRLWSTNYPHNADSGAEFYGTKGQMYLSRRGKIEVRGERNEPISVKIDPKSQDDLAHVGNFCDSIRSGAKLNADALTGHITSSLCHLGNIATRLGRSLDFNPVAERFASDKEANELIGRTYRDHWGTPKT